MEAPGGLSRGMTYCVVCLRQSLRALYGIFQKEMMTTFLGGGQAGREMWIDMDGANRLRLDEENRGSRDALRPVFRVTAEC